MKDIEARKHEIFRDLDAIESEVKKLSLRIIRARAELELVKTESDAKIFDERNDLEAGLVHIRIY